MSRTTKAVFNFFVELRVRWAEVDKQGIVFNPHYLAYFDIGLTDYYRAIGFPYTGPIKETNSDFFLRSVNLEYHASAFFDDVVKVGMGVDRIGNSSFEFKGGIFREDTLLTSGKLVYVNADADTLVPSRVPDFIREAINRFENKTM